MSNSMLEMLGGIILIKITANEEQEYKKIQRLIEEREKAQFNGQLISSLISPLNEISGIILVISIVVFGRILFEQQLQSDNVSGLLLTYLVILFRLLPFVGSLNGKRSQFASASTGLEITADFLRRDNKPYMPDGKKIYTQLSQSIDLLDVSFSYPKHNDLVLKGITLSIPKGKTVALVGSSGAGKSTIADLVPRFYDVTGGQITIDGIDIKEYNIASLRRAMGVVSQDTFLFSNTIRYNIAYGLEDVSESDIIMAAKRANAYEFIQKLAKGLDTEVGDRGIMLSGGQKQRIAIARALLRNPDILILDEATSALDTVSEKLVQQAIEELCKDRTTLVIAHRLSTVRNADKIVVLEQGKVVETGTHEELLALNGYYAKLNAMQFAKVKSDTTEFMAAENLT
ncbi:MAG: ATP-binding cassette domain-containing protein [Cyanobacteria bacterium J083]|nr:MAG: ATP-binding cassette domain-containing protein [Cyanobacteria bacterium J083]